MQISTPLPAPNPQAALPQDSAARVAQQLQPQIGTPQTQTAVKSSPKSQGDNRSRNNRERAKGGDTGDSGSDRGSKIDLRA